jgi:hypothetical protein
MNPKILRAVLAFSTVISSSSAVRAADWPTFGHDPQRSGYAFDESTLARNNVGQLELKWKARLKNEPRSLTALTAPVVAEDVDTPGGNKTVVYVAGSDDHLFALDAADGRVIWSRDFEVWVLPNAAGMWLCPNNLNATPVLDRSRNMIYAIAFDGRLWGLDLGTGKTRFGPVQFVPPFSKNWSLNLVNGALYTSLSQGCGGAQSGIYSIDIRDPMRPSIRDLLVSSKRGGPGIWGRGGVTVGTNGRIYAATGDGTFDPAQGQYGSSVIAVSLGELKVLDYYMPTNYRDVTKYDLDMGSTSLAWFSVKDFNLVAGGGKEGALYMLDADHLGTNDHQTLFTIASLPTTTGLSSRKASGEGLLPGGMRRTRPGSTFPCGDRYRRKLRSFLLRMGRLRMVQSSPSGSSWTPRVRDQPCNRPGFPEISMCPSPR